jgi:hypothetical protein
MLKALRSPDRAGEIRSSVCDPYLSGFSAFAAVYHSDGSAASLQALYKRALNGDAITLSPRNLYMVTSSRLLIIVSADAGKLSETGSISAQQVAEPQVMTRRVDRKFG